MGGLQMEKEDEEEAQHRFIASFNEGAVVTKFEVLASSISRFGFNFSVTFSTNQCTHTLPPS